MPTKINTQLLPYIILVSLVWPFMLILITWHYSRLSWDLSCLWLAFFPHPHLITLPLYHRCPKLPLLLNYQWTLGPVGIEYLILPQHQLTSDNILSMPLSFTSDTILVTEPCYSIYACMYMSTSVSILTLNCKLFSPVKPGCGNPPDIPL